MKASARFQILLGLICLLWSGCASMLPETTPYGAVSGVDSRRSLNGLAVHRKMWELAGAKCITPQKLSPRLEENLDVIVLVGQAYGPPGAAARNWLENWLSQAAGRTIIYFGRDFSADVYYRQQTLDQLPPEELDAGELELARVRVREMNQRLRQIPESTFCRWFYLDTSLARRDYDAFQGPWSADLTDAAGSWPVGTTLQTPTRKWLRQKPSWLVNPPTTKNLKPAKPPAAADASETAIQRSRWDIDELQSNETWNAEFRRIANASVLLSGDDGQPLVYRLTSDKYGDGQILIVANGAPLLNGSLVAPLHRRVGEKLIEECLPAKRVALLAYDETGILISKTPDADSRAAGLEVLTVWPLSAITMPAALLGILTCIVLFPILGRPQSKPARSVSDFGLHISALGRMLFESRDVEYAKGVIAAYYRTVRDEPPPYWLGTLNATHRQTAASDALTSPVESVAVTAKSHLQSKTSEDEEYEKHERTV
jgi:hypothetical protein